MPPLPLRILIVEDSVSYALELQMLLEQLNYFVIGPVDNSAAALEAIYGENPDLVLMDVDIKGELSGIEIGNKLKHLNIPILYITSVNNLDSYTAAKQSNIAGYLVKPADKISIRAAIELAIEKKFDSEIEKSKKVTQDKSTNSFITKDALFFKRRNSFQKVDINDIIYIQSDDNYCKVTTADGTTFNKRIGINKFEHILPEKQFMRVHRKFIVQVKIISSISFHDSTLNIGQKIIPVSRSKRKQLEAWVKNS
ncbi:MAG: response regulator transcription factor [Bacteroidetes bacterium]|nr:response regulator transcription factor [Bacteroidota bacterium]